MARIHCPRCRRMEEFNARGKWYVKCEDCALVFLAYLVTYEKEKKQTLTCPRCEQQESTTVQGFYQVECSRCGHKFFYTPINKK